jgi:hypothetical protein
MYLLFAGEHHYPSGGWEDFRGAYAELADAVEAAASSACDWWHVADAATHVVVKSGRRGY